MTMFTKKSKKVEPKKEEKKEEKQLPKGYNPDLPENKQREYR